MADIKRALMFLGLCRRSGSLKSGEENTEACVKSGKAKLVLLSEDASANTAKKFTDKCRSYHTELRVFPADKQTIGHALGQTDRSCLAITDEGMASTLLKILNS